MREAATDESVAFERLLADLSARFVNLAPEEVGQEIETGLRLIVGALDVDRSTLIEFSEDENKLITTFQWARDGIPRDSDGEVSEASSWYGSTLLRGGIVNFSRLPEDLPEDAVAEKAYC